MCYVKKSIAEHSMNCTFIHQIQHCKITRNVKHAGSRSDWSPNVKMHIKIVTVTSKLRPETCINKSVLCDAVTPLVRLYGGQMSWICGTSEDFRLDFLSSQSILQQVNARTLKTKQWTLTKKRQEASRIGLGEIIEIHRFPSVQDGERWITPL